METDMKRHCVISAEKRVLQVAPKLAAYWRALGDFRYGRMATEMSLAINTFLYAENRTFVRYEEVVAGQKWRRPIKCGLSHAVRADLVQLAEEKGLSMDDVILSSVFAWIGLPGHRPRGLD